MVEAGRPNFADYFPLLRKMDPQGIRKRIAIQFGKIVDLFRTMIDQCLEGRRPSNSLQANDALDALWGINQDKTEAIERSWNPHLLTVSALSFSFRSLLPPLFHAHTLSIAFPEGLQKLNISHLQDPFAAGTNTTSAIPEWAMAELLYSLEKLKKAQAEIKEIIGIGNPIEEADIPQLPYLQTVVKENFTLHAAVPFLVPRKVGSHVQLFGSTLPKMSKYKLMCGN